MQDDKQTIRATFTAEELDKIMSALIFHDVEYYNLKIHKQGIDDFEKNYWQKLSDECSDVWLKCYELREKALNK